MIEIWGKHERVEVGAHPEAGGALRAECLDCNITLISDVPAGDAAEFEASTREQMREQYATGFACFSHGGVKSLYYGLPFAVWPTGSKIDHRKDYVHLNAAVEVEGGRVVRKRGERLCTRGRMTGSSSPGSRWLRPRKSYEQPYCPHCLKVLGRLGASEFLIRALSTPEPERASGRDEGGDEIF